ncbi:MAG: flippase-like domain-containing protein [Acidobacteria bacterium]|nr:flippase-like domain-containing protein [Acidobacteriota bacterium]
MSEVRSSEEPGAEEETPARRRAPLKLALRVAVGGAVIGFLLSRGDPRALARAIGDSRPGYVAAAFGVFLLGVAVSALRWQVFLRPLGILLGAPTVLRLYFVGMFFNAFLPTGIGGDAYKAARLRRGPGTLAPALASVLLDRLAGLMALGAIGLVAVAVRAGAGDFGGPSRARVVGLAGLLAAGSITAGALVVAFGDRFLRGREGTGMLSRLGRAISAVCRGGRDRRAAATGGIYGIAFQALVMVSQVFLARALRLDVPVAGLVAVVVLSSLASMIPVTINGLGFREGAYVWGFGAYGTAHDSALAFALLVLAVLLATSAVGGLVYVLAGGEVQPGAFRNQRPQE